MSKGSQLEGFCMDLLSEVAKKVGFKYKVKLVKDSSYGRQDDNGNWNGMIGEVLRGEADLAIAPLTLTAAREKVVGMTKPFMQTGISILLRKDISEGAGFFDFLTPFTSETWIGILVAYMGTAASICAGPHPKALSGRVICSSWWLFSVVLLACYFSNLSSSKTPESSQLTVKGFEDLASQDTIQYSCLAGSSTLAFFKSFVSSMDEGVKRAKEGNFAFIGESVSLDLAVARHCELNLSVAILQLSEAGELAYLRSKWWASSCIADKAKPAAVQPHRLKGMFLVLALGLGLGTCMAFLELTFKSRRKAAEQQVRFIVSHE
ncbi:hypothetical protein XENOCAPTIV_013155 [Xenoophorus captivus]|uniref:Glutamate receptor n=1 Tax=Xenoophorus captivus TaxID=1517983 RepID=A0ABV0QSZ7_9TELE